MPSLHPDPGVEYYFKACRKGDATARAVTVGESAVRVLADASEITGLLRVCGGSRPLAAKSDSRKPENAFPLARRNAKQEKERKRKQ
jgi:hypothetical protein